MGFVCVVSNGAVLGIDGGHLKIQYPNDEVECIMEAISDEFDLIISYHERLMDDLMGEN